MNKIGDINENEIRVIGSNGGGSKKHIPWWVWVILALFVATVVFAISVKSQKEQSEETPAPQPATSAEAASANTWLDNTDVSLPASTVVRDTLIDSIHIQIYTPHNATPELYVGHLTANDPEIVFAALAADVRRDNGKIVGAFVRSGEPLSWGLSKKGYCAIIDGRITLGVAENSPLFEQATEQDGYFFRQYPSVKDSEVVPNNPENATFRRALCNLDGSVCIIGCTDRVMMNDFSHALAKLGVSNAIFLVGGNADGWYRDENGTVNTIGNSIAKESKYINYIVFRKQ